MRPRGQGRKGVGGGVKGELKGDGWVLGGQSSQLVNFSRWRCLGGPARRVIDSLLNWNTPLEAIKKETTENEVTKGETAGWPLGGKLI